jgi:hypothetical protein
MSFVNKDGWEIVDRGDRQVRISDTGIVQILDRDRLGEYDGVRVDRKRLVTKGHGASDSAAYRACRPAGQRPSD